MAQVRIEHVFKRFGPVTAVNDFNLTVEDGEFVSILGPSGCGKTTTLRIIGGFVEPNSGDIFFDGKKINGCLLYTSPSPRDTR